MRRGKHRYKSGGNFRGMCGIVVVIVVLLVVLTLRSSNLRQQNAEYKEELVQLEEQMDAEEERTEEIEELKEYMQSDEYVEQVAKDKLGLVYEDEIIFKPED